MRQPPAVAILVLVALCPPGAAQAPVGPIPERYQGLYSLLSRQMDDFARRYPPRTLTPPGPIWGAELLQANANRGEALLQPQAI